MGPLVANGFSGVGLHSANKPAKFHVSQVQRAAWMNF